MTMLVRQSPVCDVFFAGMRTTTIEMQRAGWQLTIYEDRARWEACLMAMHPEFGLVLEARRADVARVLGASIADPRMPLTTDRFAWHIERVMTKDTTILGDTLHDPAQAIPFDARPGVIELKEYGFDDLRPLFRPIAVPEEKQLIVDPDDVDALMRRILEVQAPKQRELRERARRGAARTVHLQLESVAA